MPAAFTSRLIPLLLGDLRAAAGYLDDLAEEASWPRDVRLASQHARRLWAAVQAIELLADQAKQTQVTPGVAP